MTTHTKPNVRKLLNNKDNSANFSQVILGLEQVLCSRVETIPLFRQQWDWVGGVKKMAKIKNVFTK